jgi:Tol biopolymer transport system component
VFQSSRPAPDTDSEIYKMKAEDSNNDNNGDNLVRITDNTFPIFDEAPAWSPDGGHITFDSDRRGAATSRSGRRETPSAMKRPTD